MATNYVSLDLETTGLDAEADVIIEIGAVRFDSDGVRDRFSALVNPRRSIPPRVQSLTGISEADVRGTPPLEVVAGDLERFLDGAVLVGHNVIGFDARFLDAAGIRHGDAIYDTQDLATLLLPGLPEYGLAALCERLGVAFPVQHRAPADAEATRELFLALQEVACRLPVDVLGQVAQWLTPTAWPWRGFFREAWELALAGPSAARPFRLDPPAMAPALSPQRQPRAVPAERSLAVLASARQRPEVLPQFDERAEQQAMVCAVAEALNEGQRLLVEAGTGTGKSLAYLIPAACQGLANGRRVVVSTATINLQDQLTGQDLPALRALLSPPPWRPEGASLQPPPTWRPEGAPLQPPPTWRPEGAPLQPPAGGGELRTCQLKGRRNYLCLRRFAALRAAPSLSDDEARIASRILLWLTQTQTGDRAELRLTQAEEAVWRRLSAEGADCTADSSPFVVEGTCFLQRARRAAEAAHIVVVNHALLLSDVASGGRLIPPYEHLVVDEAHHLEEEATRQFGFRGGESDVAELLDRCEGVAPALQSAVRSSRAALGPGAQLTGIADVLRRAAGRARPRLRELSRLLLAFLRQHTLEEQEPRLLVNRGTRAQPDWSNVEILWENLRLGLQETLSLLEKLHSALRDAEGLGMSNFELLLADVGVLAQQGQELVAGLRVALEQDDPQRIVWLERDRGDGGLLVSWAPLRVDELLRDRLYAERSSLVLTGATLTSRGNFDYIQERLGLEEANTLALGSPFDYERAALILVPRDMPEPTWPDYLEAISRAIVELARASEGRALVLFTSYASLRAAHALARGPLQQEGIEVLGQGIDGSARYLVRALQSNPRCVVLGTASFWEGIDVVGDALSLLIVTRLPFTVPTEPVFAARSALYDDPFSQYALPQAVLRFKQGFGRLIRSKTDRGVLVVLDRRIVSKNYGQAFLESLPACPVREAMLREMPGLVRGWLGAPATGARAEAGERATYPP
ncbi:MAG: 3'-5' exoribonuclease [Chloroflexi bacterium]|nr:3'-5' exoribonuclease [Chloroflexota bacterium]